MHQQTKMQIRVILITIILLILPKVLASQDSRDTIRIYKKNQIGIQLNPYINEQLFTPGGLRYTTTVSAIRYGHRVTKNITTGLDFSCFFPISRSASPYFNFFDYKIGLFTRYLYPAYSRFQIFAEVSPYYSHYWRELIPYGYPTPYRNYKFGYYFAPSVSFYSKNRRMSFDQYYKFSNLMFTNGKKAVISYKVNFNF